MNSSSESPGPDPNEHLEEQLLTCELIDQHKDALAGEAARIAQEHPGAECVGLILEAGSKEAMEFKRHLGVDPEKDPLTFIGVVPRHIMVKILASISPAAVEWMEAECPAEGQRLPVVAVTTHGVRLGVTHF